MEKKEQKSPLPLITAIGLGVLLVTALLLLFFAKPLKGRQEAGVLTSGASWRIAVLSDSMLSGENKMADAMNQRNTKQALALAQQHSVQYIFWAGGMTKGGAQAHYNAYQKTYQGVYKQNNKQPVTIAVMGAEELGGSATPAWTLRRFAAKKNMAQPPFSHHVVNGLHILALSADQTGKSPYSASALGWLKRELQRAAEEAQGRPILVLSPQPPADTVYGSDEFGSQALHDILADYPTAVSISGGTRRPQTDIRMIWQGEYTAIGCQGLSYVSFEDGLFNPFLDGGTDGARRPQDADKKPYMLILEIDDNKITVQRWNVLDAAQERGGSPWTLMLPLKQETFSHTVQRRDAANKEPWFSTVLMQPADPIPADGGRFLDGVTFIAAEDDDRVAYYEMEAVSWLNTVTVKRYPADTFLGDANASARVTLALDPRLPSGEYSVKVYAVDSFGRRSAGYQQCKLNHKQRIQAEK
ncbi:MAG: hypothetical protein FWH26_01595 [Oscillospiraceae bacterium]|nr:hypothetical protein [Oscillospiraceae bacterium]